MPRRTSARTSARFLAPLALVAFAIACLVVVNSSGGGGGGGSKSPTGASGGPARTSTTRTTSTRRPRTYVVHSGDNLSTIAERTGVPLVRLRQLNPNVDPQGLSPGQRLKLRP
jgi:LysM repeat protein